MGGLLGFNIDKIMYPKIENFTDCNDTSIKSGIYSIKDSLLIANSPSSLRYILVQFNSMNFNGVNFIGQIAFVWSSGPSFLGAKFRSYFNSNWGEWK